MGEIESYKDLKVWQSGIDLVVDTYKICASLPKEEQYGLQSQMKRDSVSIPSNEAEGYGRNSSKNFSHFLKISRGSLFDLDTLGVIATKLGYMSEEVYSRLESKMNNEAKMLSSLINKIEKTNA